MKCPHNGEQQQGGGGQIACKEDEKQEEAPHQHLLAVEGIHQIAAERT